MSKKKTDKCIFKDNWLVDDRFTEWVEKNDRKWKACCKFCSKGFDMSSMGVSALASHVAGKNTQKFPVIESLNLEPFFFPRTPSATQKVA